MSILSQVVNNAIQDSIDNNSLRYGQALFNSLSRIRPDWAAKVPDYADCFYDDEKIFSFISFVHDQEVNNGIQG